MSEKTNERLEREARESLVAADLSAKMKHWRHQTPPPSGGGGWARLLILLLTFGGAAWWFWPNTETVVPLPTPKTYPAPVPPTETSPDAPIPTQQKPMAQKPNGNRYLALAQSNYHAPNFSADIRGDAPSSQNKINDARQALADNRPADALDALQNVPSGYETDANYLRAHALFAQKKYVPAAGLFAQLKGSVRYGEAAEWYGLLALLPDFEQNKSVIMGRLKEIAGDDGHVFQQEAKTLLGAL